MSAVPDLFERLAAGLARALSFRAAGEGQQTSAGSGQRDSAHPAWHEPDISDREQQERLRELQIPMTACM